MRTPSTQIAIVASLTIGWLGALPALAQTKRAVDFNRDIKPILSNKCFFCHGPDPDERKGNSEGGLRLDTAEGMIADLGGYAAIVPGKPEESELIKRISSQDSDEVMPPPARNKALSPNEIALLKDWIQAGAKFSRHWSYIKPVRPDVPPIGVANSKSQMHNPIDNFILSRLSRENLSMSPEADRYALIRRLSLDLTGLPPTMKEVDSFVNDRDPQAYENLVDRLLAKPTFGEHWAHMWLDLARYADSAGYADDPPRTIWLFRDYVIRSFNANKPFDQFTIEQIAGDLLPGATDEQRIATAFHRNTLTNNEGGTNDEEFRNVAVVDRVNTTMAVWMGTTIACAQCHSHKYDPLSQEEYFRLFAFFNNSEDADRGDESPLFSAFSADQEQQRTKLQTEFAALETTLQTSTPELAAAQTRWEQTIPRDLKWHVLKPSAVVTQAGAAVALAEDGSALVSAKAANDTYNVEVPLEPSTVRALRLEALPDDTLPGKGPGHANGNFVITRVAASVVPPAGTQLVGRFVRIELPGKGKYLSLAEVQAFRGNDNVALQGTATQISTGFEGVPQRAIDGNTDGIYLRSNSVSHTAAADDPWWEVDLQSSQPLDRIVVWNRMDAGTPERLANFRVLVLNDARQPVWQQNIAPTPQPNIELSLSGQQTVPFDLAFADYSQANFGAENVLSNPDAKQKGWAVGGQLGQAHALILVASQPVEIKAGSKLAVTIEHASVHANHTLGKFRLSATEDANAVDWSRTPSAVLSALQTAAEQRSSEQQTTIAQHFLSIAPELAPTRERLAAVNKQLAEIKPITVPIMKDLPAAQHRVTKIQHRGNFLDVGAEVTAGVPAAFPALPKDAPIDRLALARWLVDDNNPLTARVIANRYWEQLFGTGIVSSSEEFGSQGEQPFHPELLDWLATELTRTHWDMKAFIKLLVTSAAYRQSSKLTPELEALDPDNRLLARGPRFRMSAEMVRDQALAVSGLLSSKMYGPPVKPAQPSLGLSAAFGGSTDWQMSDGEDKYRRALYTSFRRSNPYPSMATFDAPNREVCTVRRIRTNTPLQALVTLNDPVYIEAAQALARRIVTAEGSSPSDRVRFAFQLCLTRQPHEDELARLVSLYEQSFARLQSQLDHARQLATEPLGPAAADANVVELAAWTVVGNVLLNLDEFLMKR